MSRSFYLLSLFGAIIGIAAPGSAEWYEASSPHFLIYSDQTPDELHAYAIKLERFDQAVRYARGVGDFVPAPTNRLKVFAVKDLDSLQRLYSSVDSGVAGFYLPRAEGSVAFVPLDAGEADRLDLTADIIFFHEYAHHLMYQRLDAAYPAWLVEGFAEFYSTAKFEPDGSIGLGAPAAHRATTLLGNFTPLPLELMLAPNKGAMNGIHFMQMYGRGWLLTHYLTFNAERRGQLDQYIGSIQKGVPPIDAARTAFGSLEKLDRELSKYVRSFRFPYVTVPASKIKVGTVTIRPLGKGHSAMMPVILRSTRGVTKKTAPRVAADGRRIASSYPNDPEVQLALAEAEFDNEQWAAAEAAANRALQANPRLGDAMLYKGRAMMARAEKAGQDKVDWKAIRGLFIAANRLDPDDPEPLILFAESFRKSGQPMTPNAAAGLIFAYELAPQDMGLRWRAASALLMSSKDKEARAALVPIAFNPHGGKGRDKAAAVLEKIEAGDRTGAQTLLTEDLAPKKGGPKGDDD